MSEINPIDDRPIQLSELYVAALNAAFSGTFTAVFSFVPELDIKKLNDLTVTVIPGGLESSEIIDRGATVENSWLVGISFQRLVSRKDPTQTKEVLQVVRQVRDYLNANRIVEIEGSDPDYPDRFQLVDIESDPYLNKHELASGHCFSALILTFTEWEDLDT